MRAAAAKTLGSRKPGLVGPPRFRSLLVPIDLTPSSDRVLARVSRLPLAEDARVTILHVVPANLRTREQRAAERDAAKLLAEEVEHLRESLRADVRVEALIQIGAEAKEIDAAAKKVGADLIVMGRSGRRAVRDAFLGSTAERVIRRARLPVLVVRLPARKDYKRPALALDLDDAAVEIICLMLRVLPKSRRVVAVIHAYDVLYRGLVYPSLSHDEMHETKDELQVEATAKLTRLLSSTLTKMKIPPEIAPLWEKHVRHGSPRIVVEKIAKKIDADLLVLGTRAYSGAAYVLLGTVAGDLLREAKCDVLVVPPVRAGRSSVKKRAAE